MGIKVAIVGGGAAAAFTMTELLEHGVGMPAELQWYSGYRGGSRGIAYGTPVSEHLLNVRATAMGANSPDPTEFLDFARRHLPEARASDFLPRQLYGDFLEARVSRALEGAAFRGIRVSRLRTEADQVEALPDGGFRLTDASGFTSQVDLLIGAVGALPARALPGTPSSLIDGGRYVLDPWQWLSANELPFDKLRKVLIVGAGLSAVDLALTITERWPQARVTLLSRRGRLPAAHAPDTSAPGHDAAALVTELLQRPSLARWSRIVREVCEESDDWRSVIDGLRHTTPVLWQALSLPQRGSFLRHVRGIWERARHRMPPQVARRMVELLGDRRLQIRAGQIAEWPASRPGRVRVGLRARGQSDLQYENFDLVLQASGMETDARETHHSFVSSLLRQGLTRPDPLGLGLLTDTDGRTVAADGDTHRALWLIGALRRGSQWETTAIPEIRQQARRIAVQVLQHCAAQVSQVRTVDTIQRQEAESW
ncbi:MAG: FAD/NAD(P)-binding protein [Tahibacter sp.]